MASDDSSENEQVIKKVQKLTDTDGTLLSPIDLSIKNATKIQLPNLAWYNYAVPAKKMKITNTAHTVILSAKWLQERPFLTSSALAGTYVFSQLHFHWGTTDAEGSEHTVNGESLPLEMHVVHYRSSYITQEKALMEKDGLVVLVYFFEIGQPNPAIQTLVDVLKFVISPHTSAHFPPKPVAYFVRPFDSDYFLYWGSVLTSSCRHRILWLVSREPASISAAQVAAFRILQGTDNSPLKRNFRGVQPMGTRSFFHVNANPKTSLNVTLLKVPTHVCQVVMNLGEGYMEKVRVMNLGDITEKREETEGRQRATSIFNKEQDFGSFERLKSCTSLQSPVDIKSSDIKKKRFEPLHFHPAHWRKEGYATVTNTGHTAAVHIHNCTLPILSGGPLKGRYELAEVHFHWGPNDTVGSEHHLDGHSFAMEAHIVHYLQSCGSFPEASRVVNGLCVIAILLEAGDTENEHFAKLTKQLPKIKRAFTSTDLPMDSLMWIESVVDQKYYTYPGSLTTPYESTAVTWLVFPTPIQISHAQVSAFRELEEEPQHITQNYRDVQPMNNRPIYVSE